MSLAIQILKEISSAQPRSYPRKCKNGHSLNKSTVYFYPEKKKGYYCTVCNRAKWRNWYAKNRKVAA